MSVMVCLSHEILINPDGFLPEWDNQLSSDMQNLLMAQKLSKMWSFRTVWDDSCAVHNVSAK